MFSANQTPRNERKDSVRNVEITKRFCWNLATWELREYVNQSAEWFDYGIDEFEKVGLEKEMSTVLGEPKVPMVKRSPVRFECEYYSTLRLPGNPPMGTVDVVIGKVVGIHIADWALSDGKLDATKTAPIARCGYHQYTVVRELFDMIIPGENEAIRTGMEGSVKLHKAMANELNGAKGAERAVDPDKEMVESAPMEVNSAEFEDALRGESNTPWDTRLASWFTPSEPQQQ